MEEQNNNGQLQIELKEEVAQGTYANLAIITHSSSEFILDFVRVIPGVPKAILRGDSEETIRNSWQKELQDYKKMRNKYLLYE